MHVLVLPPHNHAHRAGGEVVDGRPLRAALGDLGQEVHRFPRGQLSLALYQAPVERVIAPALPRRIVHRGAQEIGRQVPGLLVGINVSLALVELDQHSTPRAVGD